MFIVDQQMIHPNQQLQLVKQHLETLSVSSKSKRYSEATEPIKFGMWSKFKMLLNIDSYYSELAGFYPYQPVVTNSAQKYKEDVACAVKTGLAISAFSAFTIFQFARRGQVLPVLRKYGKYLGTHRVFRQYIWAWTLPTVLLWTLADFNHIDNVEQLWKVHARRLQNRVFDDPKGTVYPAHFHQLRDATNWNDPILLPEDTEKKVRSEVTLCNVETYENPEFEAVEFGEDAVEEAE